MLLSIKNEFFNFCNKYNTVPLFIYDFSTHIIFKEDKNFIDLQDISTAGFKFMKNYNLSIRGYIGFHIRTYGEAMKIYKNINELSIFNGQLSIEIKSHDDIKHFKTKDSKEVTFIRLYFI